MLKINRYGTLVCGPSTDSSKLLAVASSTSVTRIVICASPGFAVTTTSLTQRAEAAFRIWAILSAVSVSVTSGSGIVMTFDGDVKMEGSEK